MDTLTSQEYGSLLRVEYGFWNQVKRRFEAGCIDRERAIHKMDRQREHILNWKQACQEELDPEDYPEEYYQDTPDPAEQVLQQEENRSEKLIAVNKTEIPEEDGTQMNIYDFLRDGEIRWR